MIYCTCIICLTCFGQLHVHHQELDSILVLLPLMVCNALVAGDQQQAMRPGLGKEAARAASLIPDA